MKKETSIALIVVGVTLLLTSIVLDAIAEQTTTTPPKIYEYIYGVDMEYTLEGYHRIVNEYIIDSVEITETDTLNIK